MKKSIKAVIWDLDGTLVHWTSPAIISDVSRLYVSLFPAGTSAIKALLATARAYKRVLQNEGPLFNDALFNQTISRSLKLPAADVRSQTQAFLRSPSLLKAIQARIQAIPEGLAIVQEIARHRRYPQIVATNPVMPQAFNRQRIALVGFRPEDFVYISGSEDFAGQKQSSSFYVRLMEILRFSPEECLMVGNDAKKDLSGQEIGIQTFFLQTRFTKHAKTSRFIPDYKGDYQELKKVLHLV
jgi:FMN phosphatase YigB (HAD superfamily)